MRTTCQVITLELTLIVAAPATATAQTRTIDLTGRPAATISEPVSGVSRGAELANGKFVFVDEREVAIQLADFSADALRVLSRTGSGPGEYRRPMEALADGKGGAVVPDGALGRAVLISGSGEVVGTGFDLQTTRVIPGMIRGFDPQGRAYRRGRVGGANRDSVSIERWDPAARTATTVAWFARQPIKPTPMRKRLDGTQQGEILGGSLFPMDADWMPLSDGSVAIVSQLPYRVDVITPAGTRIRGPSVKYQPIKVTNEYRAWMARDGGPSSKENFPETLPPIDAMREALLASPSGEVWVPRLRDWNDSLPKYDIFDRTGTLSARAVLKPHSKVIGFGRGVIYVARQSQEDDFWHLEKYQNRP